MSFHEKTAWVMGLIMVVGMIFYFNKVWCLFVRYNT